MVVNKPRNRDTHELCATISRMLNNIQVSPVTNLYSGISGCLILLLGNAATMVGAIAHGTGECIFCWPHRSQLISVPSL
jgi:tRNA U55 pseudouridine synthase TruB